MTTNTIKDLLLIQSFNLDGLIEDYRLFFLGILPTTFMLALLVEYFDRMDAFALVKRTLVAVLILTSITSFYKVSIDYSMDAANEKLESQKQDNILLLDMFDAIEHWDKLQSDQKGAVFYKNQNALWGTLAFLKYHFFDKFVNDGFTVTVFFLSKLCFVILKVVYSIIYYLGYGLVGVPVIIYMFPTMGNVLRGGILSYLWCLVTPHVLVFILSLISGEINKGYISGQVIGGSVIGTVLLFVMTLFVAFTPIITAMILNGSGISQAGGIIATMGANYVMNLPKNITNSMASVATGGAVGPKMKLAQTASGVGFKFAKNAVGLSSSKRQDNKQDVTHANGSSRNAGGNNSSSKSLNLANTANATDKNEAISRRSRNSDSNQQSNTRAGHGRPFLSRHNQTGAPKEITGSRQIQTTLNASKQQMTMTSSNIATKANYQPLTKRKNYERTISERGRSNPRHKQTT
ncbi:MAG: hypothetical protein A2504_17030 [Bdellovibrionales bacterium RIFOXYD12_FULL_39_22]|nr:MAG: hypothetical protein A2385_17855 [Bdellovibrionales bacterium RIFOXYB1_FULL_39_21]OFZ44038.1 MAG: hypothetical protein A2485_14990 [Bdellovibrionales bacterium RIFOXYC12_FULL_39_17]OFZ48291.1 MAG: hypothetical protein A2404_08720 [Bdellovibrionales bacterium RIFOXYC1_FULL_39_130]OFZ76619.1 MAG: hypothetical protein A2560_17800 [Bdellovibrionales bacterium RIFOXYD1_FULL_39_84]OFZ95540.1 MAG: hypothetical protein A2504_17030 [Bdellovibrionales bacterium RIFOXYD12_FULL_39_22]